MEIQILETNRLKLIPISIEFCKQYYVDWLNDPEVTKYLESGGDYTIEKLYDYLRNLENEIIFFWAIIIKKTENHIGNIKIDPIDWDLKKGEYGIMIGDKSEWGKGYAKEASIKVIEECFQLINEITLGFVESNEIAKKMYLSLGFIQEGEPNLYLRSNGKFEKCIRMRLLKK